jgi:hypothetical protein
MDGGFDGADLRDKREGARGNHLPASRGDLRLAAEFFRIVRMGLPGGMAGSGETACKSTRDRQCGAALPALILVQPGEGVGFSNARGE